MLSRDIAIIAAAALVMAVLALMTDLSAGWAAVGLILTAAAVAAARMRSGRAGRPPPATQDASPPAGTGHVLAEVVETLPDPFLILDGTGGILRANTAARTVFDRMETGRHVSTIIRAPAVLDAIARAAEAGHRTTLDYELRVPVERHFEANIVPFASDGPASAPSGEPKVAVLLRDLTLQERVERMRVDFVANVSHELRTPLASVLGFIETLQGAARDDSAVRDEFLELMRKQAVRMARLIDDLLSLSRIELEAHLRPEDEVDVNAVVGHVLEVMAPLVRDEQVEIEVVRPPQPLTVRGDRDELVQVFQNLVENAVKYGAAGGRVDLVCEAREDGGARVTVRDYGPGIPPEHVPRLTERFYRIDVTDSRQKGGTGLGLAIVKHILNRHRAKLSIHSRVGEGASFIVELPGATAGPDASQSRQNGK